MTKSYNIKHRAPIIPETTPETEVRVQGQLRQHNETLSQKTNKKTTHTHTRVETS
jgi:hypothetical protein